MDHLAKSKMMDQDLLKFYEASLFQLVNPKAWTISTMVASGFLPNDEKTDNFNFIYFNYCFNYLSTINI